MIAAALAALVSSMVSVVHASPSVSVASNSQIGHAILTDAQGMTLYRFTKDQGSTSACYDGCAVAWPPVLVDGVPAVNDALVAQGLGLSSRNDGSMQLTFAGAPLYYYVGDAQPGEANGQGSGGIWFVIDAPVATSDASGAPAEAVIGY